MKKKIFFAFLSALAVHQIANSQTIDEVKKECAGIGILAKANLSVAPFFVSASYFNSGLGNEIAEKIISNLSTINCFTTYNTPASSIPEGTQAVIAGDFTDYFTSEGQLGQPRIAFDLEIRNSTTQEVIAKKNFKYIGKVYVGIGKNKPLETIWNKSMDDVVIFLYQNFKLIAIQSKAAVEKTTVGETTITNEQTVRRKSILDQMEDYSDAKRTEARKNSVSYSEYFNDSVYYKSLPKRPAEYFLSYSINGKKYLFDKDAWAGKDEAVMISANGNEDDGIRAIFTPVVVKICNLQIDMFYPIKYPKIRRFHFGNDTTYDKRISSGKVNTSFKISLCSDFVKVSDWNRDKHARQQYDIFASNEGKFSKQNNVEGGYVDILYFETGNVGYIEAIFKFKTKPYINEKGKSIQATTLEGRFRVRGSFYYIRKLTDNF